jgi:hypothetical protein
VMVEDNGHCTKELNPYVVNTIWGLNIWYLESLMGIDGCWGSFLMLITSQ